MYNQQRYKENITCSKSHSFQCKIAFIVNVKSQSPRQTSMTGLPRVLGHGDRLVRVRVAKYDIGDPEAVHLQRHFSTFGA